MTRESIRTRRIARRRLLSQRISSASFETPVDVVRWFGAVQAQDYLGGLWAVGLRTRGATQDDVEAALANRTVLRTWPMRGTLHFVAAQDVRWMLDLMTPRVLAKHARRLHQEFDLDAAAIARARRVVVRALQGGRRLSRHAMYRALEAARIPPTGQRGLHILWRLAQEGLVCFGPREGKQPTFVLLDEWAPAASRRGRSDALGELARRYFTSHGPATVEDFMWWSGLARADVVAGLEEARPHLVREIIDGRGYWSSPGLPDRPAALPAAHLLPAYDEYTVAYKNRSACISPMVGAHSEPAGVIARQTILIDGQVAGTWKRTLSTSSVVVTQSPFITFEKADKKAIAASARRYGEFLGLPVALTSHDGRWSLDGRGGRLSRPD